MKRYTNKLKTSNNVTLSLDEDLLQSGREYAEKHGTSLNALIRTLLAQTVRPETDQWMEECLRLMDRHAVKSPGRKWRREDLYDV